MSNEQIIMIIKNLKDRLIFYIKLLSELGQEKIEHKIIVPKVFRPFKV